LTFVPEIGSCFFSTDRNAATCDSTNRNAVTWLVSLFFFLFYLFVLLLFSSSSKVVLESDKNLFAVSRELPLLEEFAQPKSYTGIVKKLE
jgi:hypothetical protein